MIDDHTFGTPDPSEERGFAVWRRRNQAALQAAIWLWLLFLLLDLATLFTGWASLAFTLTLQAFFSLGAGALAGVRFARAPQAGSSPGRQGALAGVLLALTTALVALLIGLSAGLVSFGSLLPVMLPYFVSLPFDLLLSAGLGLLGGALAGRFAAR